jgi:hypothetical protein
MSHDFQASAIIAANYKASEVMSPSGTVANPAAIREDGSIELNDLMRTTLARLAQLRMLGGDWDGEGGKPISVFTISKAIRLFPHIVSKFYREVGEGVRPYDVAPMSDGGIQLEWHGSGGILELEVHPNDGYGYLLIEGSGENRRFEESDRITDVQVIPLLSRIFNPQPER